MNIHRSLAERPIGIVVLLAVIVGMAGTFSCSDYENPVYAENPADMQYAGSERPMNNVTGTKWTFLLYAAADAGLMYSPLESFAAQFSSGDGVDALCLEDTNGETAKIWYIDENHNAILMEDIGEVNMGSVTTLSYFLDYAKTNYAADRYIISFYGHGGGWGGACNDYDPSFGVLRMDDMKEALEGAGGVDLVLFSAPCYMGALESAYELRECTDVYIASEHGSFYAFWRTVMGSISGELNSNPDISNIELARLIIDWMAKDKKSYARYGGMRYLTMAAVRMDRIGALGEAVDDLALGYLSDPARFKTLVESVRKKIIYFVNTSITDLNSILLSLYKVETDIAMRAKIENAMQCLSDVIIAEIHLPRYKDIQGLSLFLPDESNAGVLTYYIDDEFGLDFVQDSHWDELLFSMFPAAKDMQHDPNVAVPMLVDCKVE
jgi:hypothetical protein